MNRQDAGLASLTPDLDLTIPQSLLLHANDRY
jgi:hypothetical protein